MLICLFSLSASACSANCCINLPIRQKSCWPSRLSFRCLPCSAPVRVPVEGSLVNVRIIAVMSGGILFGPRVGIITGIIAGTHRYLIDIGGVTAVPALSPALLPGCSRAGLTAKSRKAALACRDYRGNGLRNADHDPGHRLGANRCAGAGYRLEDRYSDDPRERLYRFYRAAGAKRGR